MAVDFHVQVEGAYILGLNAFNLLSHKNTHNHMISSLIDVNSLYVKVVELFNLILNVIPTSVG